MQWTSPSDLRSQVQKLWDRGLILKSVIDNNGLFPKQLRLKKPSSQDLTDRFNEVRQWIACLQKTSAYRIETQKIQHRVIGSNTIPKAVWIDSPDQAIQLLGKYKQVKYFTDLVAVTRHRQPSIMEWVSKYPIKALALYQDWSKLLDIVDWLKLNPNSRIYIRQVDIPGIHSKFIESHRGVLMALLDLSLPPTSVHSEYKGIGQFSRRYGFLNKPLRLRFRVLDPQIKLFEGYNQDISISNEIFGLLHGDPRCKGRIQRVFITENEINFLAFPPVPNSIILFGSGYGFEGLSDISWLLDTAVYYWGDIDTNGLAILDQLRAHLPGVRSILMDEETLLAHKDFWVEEDKQAIRELTRLTSYEEQLFFDLNQNRFGNNIRLEQERVGFQWILKAIAQCCAI